MVNQIKFQTLNNKCIKCRKCSLSSTRKNVVFGRGNPNSKLFVIGEGPGQQEDEQGVAFVGRAGKMLDSAFLSVGIDTNKDCYISNIVKCRPPENRKPHKNEVSECIPWLEKQIGLIKPKVIVLAGSTAVDPAKTITFGLINSICSFNHGIHSLTSFANGFLLFGGRHFTIFDI